MADQPTLPIVTVTGVPIFSDPFAADSAGLTDYLGGLSLNEEAAARAAAYPGAVPLPEPILPEVLVSGARTLVRSIASQLTPAGIALSFFTPSPIASQDQENILLDQMNAWREFLNPVDEGTPPLPQSPALPISTPLPEVVTLPTVTVSPPQRQTPPRTVFPIIDIGPNLVDFSPVPLDVPLPDVVTPEEAPPAPPDKIAAPSLPGEVPIGLPRPGVIVIPRDIPWWEAVPAVATPTMTPEPGPSFVPFLIPSIPDVTTTPGIDIVPDVGVRPGLDTPADRTTRIPGIDIGVPSILDIPASLDPAIAVPTPDTVRPLELVPTLDVRTDLFTPTAEPLPFASPLADPLPFAGTRTNVVTDVDTCECEKKKPKKKRKPRDKCFKGTYIQRASGTIFRPTEEVPCDAPLPKKVSKRETDAFGRPVPKKRGKRRTPTWQDTLNDVFYPKP